MFSHSLQKEILVQLAPQQLSLCHESHIDTSTKKNPSISHLLEEATTWTTNHKIAQS